MSIALRYALRSDVGLVRSNNQDSGFAGPNLLVVADGMGGHAGGDVASSIAVATLAPLNEDSFGSDDAVDELERALVEAREALVARTAAEPDLAGMGTTVTAIMRSGSKLAMAHMGDSRAYLLRDGELTQVTTDHTFVQHLVDTGKITAEEAEVHPQRSVVMRVLCDFGLDLRPDVSVREGRPGDRWLLCSDGLSGYVSKQTMALTLADVEDPDLCTERLVQLALRAGGPDNITCIVADVLDPDALPEGVEPTSSVQVAGAAALERNIPSAAADGPAARAAALVASAEETADDDAPADTSDTAPSDADGAVGATGPSSAPRTKRRRTGRVLVLLAVLVLLGGGAWGGYRWTQDQYYVGIADGMVTIFRGIPQTAGPLDLSTEVERTNIAVTSLDEFMVERLEQTIPEPSLTEARSRALSLAAVAADGSLSPTPTQTPTVTPTVAPEGAGTTAPVAP